jgi:sucrose-6-phosphate hydrolase SacC (GH32 family)
MRHITYITLTLCLALLPGMMQTSVLNAQPQRRTTPEKWLPAYHYYPSGDPTGLFYFGGKYYNAWGRSASTDLVHWQTTGQQRARLGGSGSIVVDWNNTSGLGVDGRPPLLSFWHNETQPLREQVIGMAYSNDTARTWTRYETYPVLRINSREFRDPKVFWYEPDKKWVMVIGWAEIPKIMFFQSPNLIDWTFMSEFGPWGATNGVWECADFFPLPVDGDPNNVKWVLAISVQPFAGQYFVGNFDGTRFTMDPEFVTYYTRDRYLPQGQLLFDFEHGLDNWTQTGDAFAESPSGQGLYRQGAIMGREGQFYLNSFHNEAKSTGTITSPAFDLTRDYLNFKIGGAYAPNEESVNLLVDGKVVRSETGRSSNNLQWASWDVTPWRGKKAQIQVVDAQDSGYGCIFADHFVLCDKPVKVDEGREQSLWFDYGPDFFAVRAWNNYAPDEKRIIWTAWMSSWRYTGEEPMRGIQAVPREVKLKRFPEGIRLIQEPIAELQALRGKRTTEAAKTFEGVWKPTKLKPSRNVYELIADITPVDATEFGIKLCVGGTEKTIVGYNVADENIYVDRRQSGKVDFSGLFPKKTEGHLENRNGTVRLHIFVDKCSVEVFANNGEVVFSDKIYPDPSSTGIEFFSNNGTINVTHVEMYELKNTNP